MNYYIEHRTEQLLNTLLGKNSFVTISEIASQLGQTKRAVQYDLQKLNSILENFDLPLVISRKHKGIYILPENREKLKTFLKNENKGINFIFSPDERTAIIICENILSEHVKTVDEISRKLSISYNTCLHDIRSIKNKLSPYEITLKTNSGKYKFYGDGIRMRSILMYYISYLYPIIETGKLPYLKNRQTQQNLKRLHLIESEIHVVYRLGTLNKIAIFLMLCKMPLKEEVSFFEGSRSGENILALVSKYFSNYSENDRRYITVQLMGGRIKSRQFGDVTNEESHYYQTCAEHLIKSFENMIGINIENREMLVYNIAKHLSRSIYRYRYGLVDTCELDDKIRNDSKYLFKFVKAASNCLSKELNCPINDSEISLLTAYFGAHLRKNNLSSRKVHVLLAVDEINLESQILEKKISDAFPMFSLKSITISQIVNYSKPYAFLISIRLLKYEGLYVYISRQFTDNDHKHIFDTYLKYRELKSLDIPEDLFDHIKRYIPHENYSAVRKELLQYFNVGSRSNLFQLISKNNVQILSQPCGWRDALKKACFPMVQNGWINKEYIDNIIMNIELYGCYTYFENDIYLAHAQSRNNVYRSGVAVSLIPDGIIFPGNKRVRLLVVIASTDQYEHFDVLKEAVHICNDTKRIDQIMECKNVNELLLVLKKIAQTKY